MHHVMNARKQDKNSLDLFCTPPWTTRAALQEILLPLGFPLASSSVIDPCVGKGHMLPPLKEAFGQVAFFDIFDWGIKPPILDFTSNVPSSLQADWVVANPPFNRSEAFFSRAMQVATTGVAFIVRMSWLAGQGRHTNIFKHRPPTLVAYSPERIAMIEGVWDPHANTATDYVWLFWIHGHDPMPPRWFPLGMQKKYTREADFVLATPGEAKRRREEKKRKEKEGKSSLKNASNQSAISGTTSFQTQP